MIEAVVFDFDGTIADTYLDISDSINILRKKYGLKEVNIEFIKKNIGYGMENLIKKSFPDIDYATALFEFRNLYYKNCINKTKLYKGIKYLLDKIKSRKIFLITNKPFYFTLKIAKKLNIVGYFSCIIGSDSLPFKKPDKRLYELAFNLIDVDPKNTLSVGDREHDLVPIKELGGLTAFASWGYGSINSFKPDFILNKPLDLLKYI
ncbi:MAG: HAD family hydrolase [Endomicrobia bacterium]|nr:HAD family hydrolase [Endomicrobiia bacterium]